MRLDATNPKEVPARPSCHIFRGLESRYVSRHRQEQGSGAMSDQVNDAGDVERLIDEVQHLRGKVAQLQERVEQLDQLAHQDTLINLPNRRGFMRALERSIDRACRYGEHSAMLYVDLDGLKMINDSFGHAAGDQALIRVSSLLT